MIKGPGVALALRGEESEVRFNDRIPIELMEGFPLCRKHWSFVLQLHRGSNWRKLVPSVRRLGIVSVRHKTFIISISIIRKLYNGTKQER